MGPIGLMHHAIDRVGDLSAVRRMRRAAFRKRFATQTDAHLFDGVFDSFDAALASAPVQRPIGYDNPASAGLYENRLDLDEHDYPALFWLSRSVSEGMTRIADIGGSIGIKYFAFGKFIDFPADLLWRVIDVPAVVERGRAFALRQAAGSRLEFSSRLRDVDATDVVLASVQASGYRLRAHWRNVGKQMRLPFEPGYSIDHYSGFCFDLLPQLRPCDAP